MREVISSEERTNSGSDQNLHEFNRKYAMH